MTMLFPYAGKQGKCHECPENVEVGFFLTAPVCRVNKHTAWAPWPGRGSVVGGVSPASPASARLSMDCQMDIP